MSRRVCVIDVPGLSRSLLDAVPAKSTLGKWIARHEIHSLKPTWPAVTCPMQATLTTGTLPATHGIIANGVATYRSPEDQRLIDSSNFVSYRRDVSFWEQSNQLVQAKRFWQDESGRSRYRTAMLFFQNSMPGFVEPLRLAADIVITPKPEHGPDGEFTSLCWSEPRDLVPRISAALGPFPLMKYWGPMAGIESSEWIARAAAIVWNELSPQLQLVYIPHLDYDLQRWGPSSTPAIKAVQDVATALEPLLDAISRDQNNSIILLSEYSMTEVSRVVQPNRLLAEAGLLMTRQTPDGDLIDYERSPAFAMVDHQIAHVFARDRIVAADAREILARDAAVQILPREAAPDHARAGDLMLQSAADAWFDYRWWSDATSAPPFAATVDIHRKPGYDPLELLFDPATRRISQDTSRIRGSHGRIGGASAAAEPVIVGAPKSSSSTIDATSVAGIIDQALKG